VITEHHLAVSRTARFYTLGGGDGGAASSVRELWIVCHGYGQLAAKFIQSFSAVATPARMIVAPEALSRFYLDPNRSASDPAPRVGAAWMTREDREHEIADQIAYLDALAERVRAPLGDVRLRVFGFSQGVATIVRWVARGRTRADEVILWAGSFPADVALAAFKERLAGAPVVLVVGARDELASWAAADVQLTRCLDAGIPARLLSFEGGHRLDYGTLAAIADDERLDEA
jgi:predicted esterase